MWITFLLLFVLGVIFEYTSKLKYMKHNTSYSKLGDFAPVVHSDKGYKFVAIVTLSVLGVIAVGEFISYLFI